MYFKNRIIKYLLMAWMLSFSCTLFACSGGGSGNSGSSGSGSLVVTVAGKVNANIVYPGTVRIYGVNADGTLKTPALSEGQTGSDGSYSLTIGGYQGAIVGIAFGRFTDEASQTVISIPEDKCLYAALPASEVIGKSTVTLYISPLTDLAYREARASNDFSGNIAASNLAMSQLFGVDFARIAPVPFDAATLSKNTTSGDQVRLATLLAAVSQFTANGSLNPLAPTAADLQNALSLLAAGTTVTGGNAQLSPEMAYLLQQAGSALTTNGNTQPVIAAGGAAAQAMLATLATLGSTGGTKAARFRLRTSSAYSANLYGITVSVGIPAGFMLHTSASGTTQPGVVVATGQAAANSSASGTLAGSTLTIGIINPLGFGTGEFATVYGEIPAASTAPLAGAFSPLRVVKVVDGNGVVVADIAIELF